MKRSTFIIILILIGLGISVWIDSIERRAEKIFSSGGIQIRVLEAEAKGGLTKIIEPNGEMSLFSDGVKRKELSRIAREQKTLMCQMDYLYHRIKRFIKGKLAR
ncbi:MAG: hypothetical protein JSW70_08695 [Syntrophobacterales bacterium]|nr:MAG: hypothetical protein JSW70_08695 [Syntrophobacterales bacterium]